ncbi:MAG: hypothetical protein WCG52_11655, partial [bacterium]
ISQCQEFLPVASSFLQNKIANKLRPVNRWPDWSYTQGIGVSVHFLSYFLKPIHGKLIADGI